MDFNATIDLIIKDLDDARNIIDDLKRYPGVPALQIELAKAKCRSAAEVIALLKSLKEVIPDIGESKIETLQKQIQLVDEEESSVISVIPVPSPGAKETEPTTHELRESFEEQKQKAKKTDKKPPESPIIADKFSHLSARFNEQLGSQKGEEDIPEMLKTKPLSKLSDAIGVNDRFLFLREIFNDNKDAYTRAISQLDNADNMNDARAIIMSYTDDSEENKAVKQLFNLVKRKFPSHE